MMGSNPFFRPFVLLLLVAAVAGIAFAQMESGDRGIPPLDSEGLLEVGGIEVDVQADSAQQARFDGWRIAQREGFAKLWANNTKRPAEEAPDLPDSTLDGLVTAIVVEHEQIGPNRYVATLGVQFDRQRSSRYIGLSGNQRQSAPMLLIPVTVSGGTELSLEQRNPWQAAWAQFRTSNSPIDYVRVAGQGSDPLLVNAAASRRTSLPYWKSVAEYYGVTNVLVAEVQLNYRYPGGPATGHFTARYGLEREVLGRFTLAVAGDEQVPAMMQRGAQRMDEIFARAFSRGRIRANPALIAREEAPPEVEESLVAAISYQIQFASPTRSYVDSAIAALRAVPGVEGVGNSALQIGGVSQVTARYRGSLDEFRSALRGFGWNTDYSSGVLRMSPAAQPAAPSESEPESPSDSDEG